MSVTRTTTRDKKREYLYLRCLDCPKNPKCGAISYQKVLETTIERICEDLPKAVAKMNVPSIDGIKTTLAVEIDRKREILARLPSLQEQGILDEETMLWRSYKIRAEISQIQNQIARLPPVNLQALARNVSIAQFWLDLSETERRFYFREFIRQIEIINSHSDDWQLKLVFIF